MEKKTDFRALLFSAWTLSWKYPALWALALVSASAMLLQNFWFDQNQISSGEDLYRTISAFGPRSMLLFALFLSIIFVLSIFGKSNLVAGIYEVQRKFAGQKGPVLSKTSPFLLFWKGLRIEVASLLLFALLALVLICPILLSESYNPEALPVLVPLSLLTFLPLAIILFFVKEFAFYYSIFSSLSVRQCFENGSKIFSRIPLQSLRLGILTIALVLLFTFSVNLAMLGIAVLFGFAGIGSMAVSFSLLFSLVLLTWFTLFRQALWTLFFLEKAGPKFPEDATLPAEVLEKAPEIQGAA